MLNKCRHFFDFYFDFSILFAAHRLKKIHRIFYLISINFFNNFSEFYTSFVRKAIIVNPSYKNTFIYYFDKY